ncbi:MAG: hypothetical protein QOK04_1625 [Solirubrobacteraceae bacterium]|jgi:predicted PhzF superfamily epimerase YddE/YHI9|nr:hypothetical protein [Solirubrobacteraceae bacterium]
MAILHVLRVFVGDDGNGGNPLGVFLDGAAVPPERRGVTAARLGFSETVFVDDLRLGDLRIFTPAVELEFAGHPLVGTAWLLAAEGQPLSMLRPPAGEVPARAEGEWAFIAGRPEWAPPFEHVQFEQPAEVDALRGPPDGRDTAGAWAWEDERAGFVRARVFASRYGVEEDEATGAHAVLLCAALGREIVIRQGRGSKILARPRADGTVEIGGRVALDERREFDAS